MEGDVLALEGDRETGDELICQVMRDGKRLLPSLSLDEIRAYAARELECLPRPLQELEPGAKYPVELGKSLRDLAAEFDRRFEDQDRKR